jgi:hypothetical protein
MVVGVVVSGGQARPVELAVVGVPESDGEGLKGLTELEAGQGHDTTGIQPAAQEGPHRNVGAEPEANESSSRARSSSIQELRLLRLSATNRGDQYFSV